MPTEACRAARRRCAELAVLIAALTVACFWPVLSAGFVNFDDDRVVVGNPHLAFDGASLAWMFSSFHMGHYQPLTWLSLAADRALWGGDARGFHATNLAWHMLASVLAFLLARALFAAGRCGAGRLADGAAAIAALAFAVHPLRVESVAWISERRDVLSGTLYLAAILAYLRCVQSRGTGDSSPRGTRHAPSRTGDATSHAGATATRADETSRSGGALALVVTLQVLSLLSKAWAVSLPLVLLVLNVWPLRRWQAARTDPALRRRLRRELAVTAVPSALFLVLAGQAQQAVGTARAWEQHDLLARTLQAAYGLCFYPLKTLLPFDLSPLYPLGARLDRTGPRFLLAAVAVLAAACLLFALRRRVPSLVAATVAYAVIVAPVLGFWQSGPQLVADRYSYLACVPFALLLGAGALHLARRVSTTGPHDAPFPPEGVRRSAPGGPCPVETVSARDRGSANGPPGAGEALGAAAAIVAASDTRGAGGDMRADAVAARRAGSDLRGVLLLGLVGALLVAGLGPLTLAQARTWHDSVSLWTPAVRLTPDSYFARYQLGKALLDAGRAADAVPHMLVAVERAPPDRAGRLAVLHTAAGALAEAGRLDEAMPLWHAVLELDSRHVDVLTDLGTAHALRGENDLARAAWERAVAACNAGAGSDASCSRARAVLAADASR